MKKITHTPTGMHHFPLLGGSSGHPRVSVITDVEPTDEYVLELIAHVGMVERTSTLGMPPVKRLYYY